MSAADPSPSAGLYSLESEYQLLSGLFQQDADADYVFDRLQPEHFYQEFTAEIFAAAQNIWRAGRPILIETVRDRLGSSPLFAEMGGIGLLADMLTAGNAYAVCAHTDAVLDYYTRRELQRLGSETAVKAGDTAYENASKIISEVEADLTNIVDRGMKERGLTPISRAVSEAVRQVELAGSREGALVGLPTGLIDLDRKIGGLVDANLIILAARPSMGKSALALIIAFYLAKLGKRIAFFSLEMSAEELSLRLLSYVTGIPFDRMRKGECTAPEHHAIRDAEELIASLPLLIDETGGIAVSKLGSRARRMKRAGGLDLIVVDYLQLATADNQTDSRVQEVSKITQGLKGLAKDLKVPVLALSQLSRALESRQNKRPMLSDLRDSGSIEQDADVVMFVYRESYYLDRDEPAENSPDRADWLDKMEEARGRAELIVAKQRQGPIGTVHLHFNEDLALFGNSARNIPSSYGGQHD